MPSIQSTITADSQHDNSPQVTSPEMCDLINKTKTAVTAYQGDWSQTGQAVADALRAHLPSPNMLSPQQRLGAPDHYCSIPLYIEPDTFSIMALVWRPGQETPIHDHVTWCVFGVIQGVEYEELFKLNYNGRLIEAGENRNLTGTVDHLTPPGDIHRVRNAGDSVAISIHIYGTDVNRMSNSVRRIYDPISSRKSPRR